MYNKDECCGNSCGCHDTDKEETFGREESENKAKESETSQEYLDRLGL